MQKSKPCQVEQEFTNNFCSAWNLHGNIEFLSLFGHQLMFLFIGISMTTLSTAIFRASSFFLRTARTACSYLLVKYQLVLYLARLILSRLVNALEFLNNTISSFYKSTSLVYLPVLYLSALVYFLLCTICLQYTSRLVVKIRCTKGSESFAKAFECY